LQASQQFTLRQSLSAGLQQAVTMRHRVMSLQPQAHQTAVQAAAAVAAQAVQTAVQAMVMLLSSQKHIRPQINVWVRPCGCR
jgi:hypothetical protein